MSASPFAATLRMLHDQVRANASGEVATYIPELGRADPEDFAISIATTDGHLYSAGDDSVEFTVQSLSKPFVYGLALDDNGLDDVLARVDVEPSGEAFNAISLEPGSGRPRNPMINAGAIATNALVRSGGEGRWERVLAMLSAYAGRPLTVDEAVFRSEQETGHRNRAIGHLLRNAGILEGDVDAVVDCYFRQCSVLADCRDLAVMAATLANGGRNPRTGVQAIGPENVERVLSVMSTSGMYDYAGAWVFRVGMPAKSGVAGGVLAVLPGQLGIGVYSPRLDAFGNSVRGVAVCEALSREFGLHLLRPPLSLGAVVRSAVTLAERRSRRWRTVAENEAIDRHGESVRVYQLQGPLVLSTAEVVLRQAFAALVDAQTVLFDCRRVTRRDASVTQLFGLFAREAARRGGRTVFAGLDDGAGAWARSVSGIAGVPRDGEALHFFADVDAALAWCEDELMERAGLSTHAASELPLGEHPLVVGLPADEQRTLSSLVRREVAEAGVRIIEHGSAPDALFLLVAGTVDVTVDLPGGRGHRLATLAPGATFGELALTSNGARSANVEAVSRVVFHELRLESLAEAEGAAPLLRLHLLERIANDLAERLRRANLEIAALAS